MLAAVVGVPWLVAAEIQPLPVTWTSPYESGSKFPSIYKNTSHWIGAGSCLLTLSPYFSFPPPEADSPAPTEDHGDVGAGGCLWSSWDGLPRALHL